MANPWERYPDLEHLSGKALAKMQRRRRQKFVRYWLFRMQDAEEMDKPLLDDPLRNAGFYNFWLEQRPEYQMSPTGVREPVAPDKRVTVERLGGYKAFASRWDVDEDLTVYIRHSSVWQEWNAVLYRVVPVLGER